MPEKSELVYPEWVFELISMSVDTTNDILAEKHLHLLQVNNLAKEMIAKSSAVVLWSTLTTLLERDYPEVLEGLKNGVRERFV